jgi:hypothetical protein
MFRISDCRWGIVMGAMLLAPLAAVKRPFRGTVRIPRTALNADRAKAVAADGILQDDMQAPTR